MAQRRRRHVVESFQCRVGARIVAYAFIYQLTVWNLMFCLRLMKTGGDFLTEYRDFFVESYPMLFCVLLLAPAFAWDVSRRLHRVAGPIYRFRQTIKLVTAGQPVPRIRLRAGDELTGMQDELNAMLDALAQRGAVTVLDASSSLPEDDSADAPLLRLAR
jgi:hypothetical protein